MRTLQLGLRVADLERSLEFYAAVGYERVGEVPETDIGHLTMLKLPGDEFVTLELVHDPSRPPGAGEDSRLSHVAIQVESLDATLAGLAERGIDAERPASPGGDEGPRTSMLVDPDGNLIELVQWPDGHAEGMSAADFAR